jgi:hypothetical protein
VHRSKLKIQKVPKEEEGKGKGKEKEKKNSYYN